MHSLNLLNSFIFHFTWSSNRIWQHCSIFLYLNTVCVPEERKTEITLPCFTVIIFVHSSVDFSGSLSSSTLQITLFLHCSVETLLCVYLKTSPLKNKILHLLFMGFVYSSFLIWVCDQWHDWQICLCASKLLEISKCTLNLCSLSKVNPLLENSIFLITWKNETTKGHTDNIFPSWSISKGFSFK